MRTSESLTGAQWRKSSYSGGTGGDCVECAPLNGAAWHKSPSGSNTGGGLVAVRDSKNPGGPAFTVGAAAFEAFVGFLSA